jgi:flagella synthesis protein FlgN
MDVVRCRDALARLVAAEAAALTELEQILDVEHAALVANDADALIRAGESRQRHVNALVRVEEERRSLCRSMGVPSDRHGLDTLLRKSDASGELTRSWGRCATLAGACRRSNDRNGALVAARMKHVEQVLTLLTPNAPGTYGRRGRSLRVGAGRVVATRA